MNHAVRPAPFAFSDDALEDLRRRVRATRWPEKEPVDDWRQGAPLAKVQELCARWSDGYDWRPCEARLNALSPSVTEIDGLDIHFLHLRSPEPDALPLVMTHGWPGSVIEFLEAAPRLADPRAHGGDPKDAFHVVLPSLPGYGLSGKPDATGWNVERIARAWIVLMQRLGYPEFVAQGGDWGSAVTNALGALDRRAVKAIHLNMVMAKPPKEQLGSLTAEEKRAVAAAEKYAREGNGYAVEQSTKPQTIGYALADSPAGQAAWIYEKLYEWTDNDGDPASAVATDAILDNITLYWLTNTAASSARLYWESFRSFNTDKVEGPVACSVFPYDLTLASRRWAEHRYPDLVYWGSPARGGHFAAWEVPDLFVDEVRAGFRPIR